MNPTRPREPLHIVFAGGGTGGHLFPGLAVARRLMESGIDLRVTLAGGGKPLERRQVATAGYDYLPLSCRPMPRRPGEVPGFVVRTLAGYFQARRLLRRRRVAAVVGLGGYASVPMARAAVDCGIPLVLLEQNVVPGKATRWLARKAAAVCLAFEGSRQWLDCRCPVYVTGTPIRRVSGEDPHLPDGRQDDRRRTLLVLGGSSGALWLNEHVPRCLAQLAGRLEGWHIVHQSGEADFEATRVLYGRLSIDAEVTPFLADVPAALKSAGLAVSRAGGTTLAELAAAGVPAVLLPYPHAADDHQRRNAELFGAAGAALLLDQREQSARPEQRLAEDLAALLAQDDRRAAMAAAMTRLARPEAADRVAEIVLAAAGKTSPQLLR